MQGADTNGTAEQQRATEGWDEYYRTFEAGAPLGNEYPNECLVRFVSNQRKAFTASAYFDDHGRERTIATGFEGRALELGFGTIANLAMVRRKGYRVDGLEVSAEAVRRGRAALAREGAAGDVTLALWTPPALPFRDGIFALVYGLQCIYYTLRLEALLAEVERVLAPGGKFIFSFFARDNAYVKFLEPSDGSGVWRWSAEHPNPRLRGIPLRVVPSKGDLAKLFDRFRDVRIFTTTTDETPMYHSWWYVCGSK
jgi:SAM-dependent methyltransferase